jgi:hypothetical protein
LEIRAASEPAVFTQVLQLDVAEGVPYAVTVIYPTPIVTLSPSPTTMISAPQSDFVTPEGHPRFSGWLLILFVLGGGGLLAYWVGGSIGSSRWRIRWMLCSIVGGLIAYNYMALGMPGAVNTLVIWGGGALVGFTVLGEGLGALAAWFWMRRGTK